MGLPPQNPESARGGRARLYDTRPVAWTPTGFAPQYMPTSRTRGVASTAIRGIEAKRGSRRPSAMSLSCHTMQGRHCICNAALGKIIQIICDDGKNCHLSTRFMLFYGRDHRHSCGRRHGPKACRHRSGFAITCPAKSTRPAAEAGRHSARRRVSADLLAARQPPGIAALFSTGAPPSRRRGERTAAGRSGAVAGVADAVPAVPRSRPDAAPPVRRASSSRG